MPLVRNMRFVVLVCSLMMTTCEAHEDEDVKQQMAKFEEVLANLAEEVAELKHGSTTKYVLNYTLYTEKHSVITIM